jgi:serine/threonine-protein kinase
MRSLIAASATAVAASLALIPAAASAADPTTADCLAAADSSADLRPAHKLRAAREKLLICSAATCPLDVRNECIRRVAEVNAAIPTIVFETKDASGNDVAAVKVTMDGQVLATRLEGVALSIDPGEHSFAFEAAGQPPLQKSFVIREGEKERRERIVFGRADGSAAKPGSAASEAPGQGGSAQAAPDSQGAPAGVGQTQRLIGLVVGGAGILGMGASTVMVLVAKSQYDTAASESGAAKHADSVSATGLANGASVVFVIGAAATVGGAVVWLTAPRAPVAVGTNGRELLLSGSFQ